jgi:hypothetical protein
MKFRYKIFISILGIILLVMLSTYMKNYGDNNKSSGEIHNSSISNNVSKIEKRTKKKTKRIKKEENTDKIINSDTDLDSLIKLCTQYKFFREKSEEELKLIKPKDKLNLSYLVLKDGLLLNGSVYNKNITKENCIYIIRKINETVSEICHTFKDKKKRCFFSSTEKDEILDNVYNSLKYIQSSLNAPYKDIIGMPLYLPSIMNILDMLKYLSEDARNVLQRNLYFITRIKYVFESEDPLDLYKECLVYLYLLYKDYKINNKKYSANVSKVLSQSSIKNENLINIENIYKKLVHFFDLQEKNIFTKLVLLAARVVTDGTRRILGFEKLRDPILSEKDTAKFKNEFIQKIERVCYREYLVIIYEILYDL